MSRAFRVGGLSYLNTRPLVYGLEHEVIAGDPAQMADLMSQGALDAAIVPVAEVLREDRYDIVDGIAIAARGPVFSVFLRHCGPVAEIRRVRLDAASRTSVWLTRVLLKGLYGIEPALESDAPLRSESEPPPHSASLRPGEAELMIGDRAIEYRLRNGNEPVLDLGEAWWNWMGLPFVFAVWALQRSLIDSVSLVRMLREAKEAGLAHLDEIAARSGPGTSEFRREYLRRYVQYDLADAEKAGLRRFQQLCCSMGLIHGAHELRFIG